MYRFNSVVFVILFSTLLFYSCDEVINPELEEASPVLVIDAWLNNAQGTQQIFITRSQPYFESVLPPGVSGATVLVSDENGKIYTFSESKPGVYVWSPVGNEVFGEVGLKYDLSVQVGTETFVSEARMGRAPVIDSITFFLVEGGQFADDQYQAEFWATDPIEPNDAYWIKTFKNSQQLLKPSEIVTAYDAGFSKGANFSGITFIAPLRTSINPFDEDDDGNIKSPYVVGDSIYVQIQAITEAGFNFLNEVRIQTDRPGGFSELFATPLANVATNISNVNSNGSKVLGFFNVGAVSGLGRKFNSLDDLTKN
ncbi:MAG TPA: DUF4249 domain-containing protein [Cyclobacteriaceae bacterium]|nr:DUF4249 domain-containing protein [Cyclobacteriaceae bacterium]HPW62108.1 DUF4249 domain-containing protein [Cyclobacteriaceae bacterium]